MRTHKELACRSRHRFLEPIHNVKVDRRGPYRSMAADLVSSSLEKPGGAYRDRTDDLMLAKQPLSQLS